MAAKLFHSRSPCAFLTFKALIISSTMMVLHARLHASVSQCDATSSYTAATITTARVDTSEAQAEMMISENSRNQTAVEPFAKLMCNYTITTVTGKKLGAGTDSTISLRLYNNASQNVYFPSLDNGDNNFERGKVDKFLETGDCVTNICKMALYTDNSGFMPSWFVDSVGVSVPTPTAGVQTTTWQLREWLPRDDSTEAFLDIRDNCATHAR